MASTSSSRDERRSDSCRDVPLALRQRKVVVRAPAAPPRGNFLKIHNIKAVMYYVSARRYAVTDILMLIAEQNKSVVYMLTIYIIHMPCSSPLPISAVSRLHIPSHFIHLPSLHCPFQHILVSFSVLASLSRRRSIFGAGRRVTITFLVFLSPSLVPP